MAGSFWADGGGGCGVEGAAGAVGGEG